MARHRNQTEMQQQQGAEESQELQKVIESERFQALHQLEDWLETPVIILGFFWLVLLIVDLLWGLTPFLNALMFLIWGVFILDFALRLLLAPHKWAFLRHNWLTALSLFIPALRIGRIARLASTLRALRAARGLRLVSMISSVNRGMRSLRRTMQRRGFGYVIALTLLVTLVGAAGMFAFEGRDGGGGLSSYGEALWWTAMLMTTLGSEYWPQTAEGRLLALLLALFAFAIFGYVTATLATYFIGRDVEEAALEKEKTAAQINSKSDTPHPADSGMIAVTGAQNDENEMHQLQSELNVLREEMSELHNALVELRQALSKAEDDHSGDKK